MNVTWSNINWQKGLNRIFVLVCMAWIVFVIFAIFAIQYMAHDSASTLYYMSRASADAAYRNNHDKSEYDRENKNIDDEFKENWDKASFSNIMRMGFDHPAISLAILIVPPVALYLAIFVIYRLSRWIVNGFLPGR